MAKWKKPPLVEVTWWDAWSDLEKDGTVAGVMATHAYLLKRFTVGYLVGQTDLVVVLAHDFDPPITDDAEERVSHLTVIPVGWVKNIRVVGGKGKKNGKLKPSNETSTGASTPKAGSSAVGYDGVQPEPTDTAVAKQAK